MTEKIGGRLIKFGDNVNTAQRLETAAKPNEVVISQSTYEFVKDFVEVEEVGPFKLKGKANPVPGYKVVRVKGR
jgi:adenylate cyclase